MKKTSFKLVTHNFFIFIMCLVFTNIQVKAQNDTIEYNAIPDNAIWSVNTLKFKTHGDTLINGKSYLKVYFQSETTPFEFELSQADYFCAIRNDTNAKRVYGVYKAAAEVITLYSSGASSHYNSTDTTEFLLYDFSLTLGDTVLAASFSDTSDVPCRIIIYHFVCTSTADSLITLNDYSVRRSISVDMSHYVFDNAQHWMEGIGSTNGFFSPAAYSIYNNVEAPKRRLLCFSHNETLLISFPEFDYDSSPDDCYCIGDISNIKEYNMNSGIKLYPNPANDCITLIVENIDNISEKIEIYNMLGQLMLKQNSWNKTTIDISSFPQGLYVLKAKTADGICVKKFVKE